MKHFNNPTQKLKKDKNSAPCEKCIANIFGYAEKNHWWWITKGHKKFVRDEKNNWNLDTEGGEG